MDTENVSIDTYITCTLLARHTGFVNVHAHCTLIGRHVGGVDVYMVCKTHGKCPVSGWPGVSRQCVDEIEHFICNIHLSVAACTIV